jgi:hypothetical protein
VRPTLSPKLPKQKGIEQVQSPDFNPWYKEKKRKRERKTNKTTTVLLFQFLH